MGDFDDILGEDKPVLPPAKTNLNRRLIEMYEKIVEKDMKKYQDHWKNRAKNTKYR
jgi:hypothetical protein